MQKLTVDLMIKRNLFIGKSKQSEEVSFNRIKDYIL